MLSKNPYLRRPVAPDDSDVSDVQNLVDETQALLDKKVDAEAFESKLEDVLSFVSNLESGINNKLAVWKWTDSDITLQGQVTPERCQLNTMGDNCLWSSKESRIKLQLSGVYRIELFVKYFTRERDRCFFLCFDDEPVLQHPADRNEASLSGDEEASSGPVAKAADLEICMTRYFNFEAGKTVSMYYSKKCQTVGVISIQQV